MNCQQVQVNLSLYLYGELEFAKEEELELHLADCSLCQLALSREKSWHTSLNAERDDVPLELLSQCRRDLRLALQASAPASQRHSLFLPGSLWVWLRNSLDFRMSGSRWSPRLAFASLFLFLGFSLSRWTSSLPGFANLQLGESIQAGLTPSFSRIRAVQAGEDNRVRIVIDQVRQREIVGTLSDTIIRQLLLQGSKDPTDPGLRVDAVELLKDQDGTDIRDTLLHSVLHDENAAVRLKALEGLRHFNNDRQTRDVLVRVLQEDGSPAVRTEAIDVLVPAESAGPVSPDLALALQGIVQTEPTDDYLHARCLQILSAGRRSGLY